MKDTKPKQMDLQIDKMLRNHLKSNPIEQPIKCNGFDPDLAAAYGERTLGSLELKQYESHLADCKNCRQMTAEYMLLFATEMPIIEEAEDIVKLEVKEVSKATKESGLSWTQVKEWLFGSQVRWAMAALLILFISGAIWMFSGTNKTSQTAGTNKGVEKNTQPETNPINKVDSPETAINNGNNQVITPTLQPTPDNNLVKTPKQNQDASKTDPLQTPKPNDLNIKQPIEVAKGNSVKLPSLTKDDNLPDIANNNKATPPINITDPLQVPPPPVDVAQNPEKNTPKNPTTNSSPNKSPRNGTEFGVGIVDSNIKDKKSIGGKTFLLKSGVWTDQEYITNAKAKGLRKLELKKGSEDYQKSLSASPDLKAYFEIGTSVTVVYKDTVYIVK